MGELLTAAANTLNAVRKKPEPVVSFVLPEQKVVYVANPGVADTPAKWLLAVASGQDADAFHRTRRPMPTRTDTVHVRAQWRGIPTLEDYLDNRSVRSLAKDDWFVFTFVYEPRARLWATWQLRFLAGDPHLSDEVLERDWFPREPDSAEQVIADFARFVRAVAADGLEGVPLANQLHAQTDLVRWRKLRYSNVYDPAELDTMRTDLADHLRSLGQTPPDDEVATEALPLPLIEPVLAGGIDELITTIYAADMKCFGSAWSSGADLSSQSWDPAALKGLQFQRAAHRRIRDVSLLATDLDSDIARLRANREPNDWESNNG